MQRLLFATAILAVSTLSAADPTTALDFKMKAIDGKQVSLSKYQGKVVLIVNVASECGLTDQYKELQILHQVLSPKGFTVLGFPCNQFGKQEPGTDAEIQSFCETNYKVSFDMFSKVEVNGANACKLYQHLTQQDAKPAGKGKVKWNFEKFLLGKDGKVAARFAPNTTPSDPKILKRIKEELEK